MRTVRRAAYPLRLAWAGIRARPGRALLVAVGIAAGAGVLATVLGAGLIARERSVARAIERIDEPARAVRAVSFGAPSQLASDYPALDRRVRSALAGVTDAKPAALVLYRESTIAGSFVGLGAVDDLSRWIELRSGRLPRPCRPDHCEVVQLGGEGSIPDAPGLRLVRVGRASLTSSILFGDFLAPTENARDQAELSLLYQEAEQYHQPPPPPILLANRVAGLVRSPVLQSSYRSFAWVVPLDGGAVRQWEIPRFAAAVTRARSELEVVSDTFDLLAPVQELQEARTASETGGRRLLLVGGEAAALLVAFTILAATSLRRDAEARRRRLSWFGARRWQLGVLGTGEAVVLGVVGTVLGWCLGVGAAAALAAQEEAPVDAVLQNSVLSGSGVAAAGVAAGAAVAILLATLTGRSVSVRGRSVSAVDVLALAAVAVIAVGLARGDLDPETLARDSGAGWYLLFLPGLVTFVVAVAAARLFVPAARLLERVRRGNVPFRLAALSIARSPGRAAVAAAFFAVSLGLALFAASYRSTLEQGQRDQAAFAVPADVVVREDLSRLIPVLDAAPIQRFDELGPGVAAAPVIRLTGSVSRLGTTGITALGIDPRTLGSLPWRSDFSRLSPEQLSQRIEAHGDTALRGLRLPSDATALAVRATGRTVSLRVALETPGGRFSFVDLGRADGTPDQVLEAALPPGAAGGKILSAIVAAPRLRSNEAGGAIAGELTLGPLLARTPSGDVSLPRYPGWLGDEGVDVDRGEDSVTLRYTLTNDVVSRFRPPQPTDGKPIPVIASTRLAAAATADGLLPVQLGGQRIVVRVAATASLFPGIAGRFAAPAGDFVVADRELLATAVNSNRPGAAVPSEVWLDARTPGGATALEAKLRDPPFDVLEKVSRSELERDLAADPLARGVLSTLLGAAAVALVLGLVGLALVLAGDLRDDGGQLYDLEAQGMGPSALRRVVRLRAGGVAVAGLLWGIVGGAALAALVVDVVAVTANATAEEPPLRLAVDWRLAAIGLAAYALGAVVIIAGATGGAFGGSGAPARLPEVDE